MTPERLLVVAGLLAVTGVALTVVGVVLNPSNRIDSWAMPIEGLGGVALACSVTTFALALGLVLWGLL